MCSDGRYRETTDFVETKHGLGLRLGSVFGIGLQLSQDNCIFPYSATQGPVFFISSTFPVLQQQFRMFNT
jgi:hypothetical protein